jgi:hypothetical protein
MCGLPSSCCRDVEQYFTKMGCLLPAYHRSYWIGLRVPDDAADRTFTFLDGAPGGEPRPCNMLNMGI